MLLFCVMRMVLGVVFFLSLLRGGVIDTPLTRELQMFSLEHLFWVSSIPLCSRNSADISGSCSGDFVQLPFTCVQFMRHLASGSFGKGSGSVVEDSSTCHPGCLVQIPSFFIHFIPTELVSFSSEVSRKKRSLPRARLHKGDTVFF